MYQRDYILRLIEQFTRVLAKIIFNKEAENFEACFPVIKSAYTSFTGMDGELIHALDEDHVIELLGTGDVPPVEKLSVIAELLRAEAEIEESMSGMTDGALLLFSKSFYFYTEIVLRSEAFRTGENFRKTVELFDKISRYRTSGRYKMKAFRFFEFSGNYAKAEDILFELADENYPEVDRMGPAYYDRLSALSDDELHMGNMTRNELIQGREKLRTVLERSYKSENT